QALEDSSVASPRSGYGDDGGVLSGNFNLDVPIVTLSGRGLDLALRMHYGSLVWGTRGFDPDAGWPAPGWSLGFGTLTKVLLIDQDGTRHPLQAVDATHSRTVDASLIDVEWGPAAPGQ